ncbi:hypothetical protein Q3O59_00160 [Alkalimonas delamerensis]|uniref:HicB_like antitoxin of toxin-antitoxin system n=1 Tax=Alkalimonas delamerensis TaxID=265981 RepID=A0ABT9GKE5_9GAMM|nr:hypothetical protein [Alkalimonas delamerensis]MDP4527438.1 hypothetical protein [Alkalimonas delamerensis]
MSETYEEEFLEYTIYVEVSADRYNPAFSWSICKDDIEYDSGLAFSKHDAIAEAEAAITGLKNKSA